MIAIGSDHAGFWMKEELIKCLRAKGVEVKDFGTYSKDSVDYSDYALLVSESVISGESEKGILICGTGIGISIAANKVPGIRCALCSESYSARMTREHNDSNVLALGGRTLGLDLATDIMWTWLGTEFLGGKHQRRLDKLTEIEKKYIK